MTGSERQWKGRGKVVTGSERQWKGRGMDGRGSGALCSAKAFFSPAVHVIRVRASHLEEAGVDRIAGRCAATRDDQAILGGRWSA